MLQRLVDALVRSKNEAADEVLLDALRIGNVAEQANALDALIRRETVFGLSGVISQFGNLPEPIKLQVLKHIRFFSNALREGGRSSNSEMRMASMRLIAQGRLGRLSYVLSDNLHQGDERLGHCAAEALVALARWVSTESRALHRLPSAERASVYRDLNDNRPEIEQTIARAMNAHRGKYAQELLRAGMLLCDWTGSRVFAVLQTPKHGGQTSLARRMQQPPASEHVEAFLLGASHGGQRLHFGNAFAQINEKPVLDAMLRKTHWLKDHQVHLCMHQATRGQWLVEQELLADAQRREPIEQARVGAWINASGADEALKDDLLAKLLPGMGESREARLDMARLAMRKPRGAPTKLLQGLVGDSDENIARIAVRELIRRRMPECDNFLLQRMATVPDSVRRVIGRAIGQSGFEQYWERFDRLDKATRRSAGRAMMKLFADSANRLARRIASGSVADRVKAMQIAHELEVSEPLRAVLLQACADTSPKVRSKAVQVLGQLSQFSSDALMDRVLTDPDARVRANAIEVLESRQSTQYIPMLTDRARQATNRERANAIKALHRMRVGAAAPQLLAMLKDGRAEHRISALWTLRQIGIWQMVNEVARLAREDDNVKVRRYAIGVLRAVASAVQQKKKGSA